MNVRYRVDLSQIERTALRALVNGEAAKRAPNPSGDFISQREVV
jgi:hypothetical protein